MITKQERELFQETVWDYYHQHGRQTLPWRQPEAGGSFNAYKIMISEIMLQQTQVARVIPKYQQFLALFPTVQALAAAPLAQVLVAWSGLGYNRRAKFLWQAARAIVQDYDGELSDQVELLCKLPGIGVNTAGAIVAYAHNQSVVFIETNVRTVYIHHFFADNTAGVHDKEILVLATETADREHPREWYWALMDYGTHLKQTVGNLNRNSKSYAKQSKFEGSLRQIRGAVIRLLAAQVLTAEQIAEQISDDRVASVLHDLEREKLIQKTNNAYHLPGA